MQLHLLSGTLDAFHRTQTLPSASERRAGGEREGPAPQTPRPINLSPASLHPKELPTDLFSFVGTAVNGRRRLLFYVCMVAGMRIAL